MSGVQKRTTVPSAVGQNRERIRILEAVVDPISMRRPALMGLMMGGAAIPIAGMDYPTLRVRSGFAYRPDITEDLVAGDKIVVDYLHHSGPRFGWLAVRLHLVEGLTLNDYHLHEPGLSDPFDGSIGSYTATTTFDNFTSFMAVTNDEGETVSWDNGVGAEQYSWDPTGVGHIGYAFHDFSVSPFTGTITASFSGSSTQRSGAIGFSKGTPVTVGTMVGENEILAPGDSTTKQIDVTLTDDIPAGSVVIVVVASWDFDPDGASASFGDEDVTDDVELRPFVTFERSIFDDRAERIPHFYSKGQWWPVGYPYEGRSDHQHGPA